MPRPRRSAAADARAAVQHLLAHHPESPAELRRAVRGLDPRHLATAVVDALRAEAPRLRDEDLLIDLLRMADPAVGGTRARQLLTDADATLGARARALLVLAEDDPRRFGQVPEATPEVAAHAYARWIHGRLIDLEMHVGDVQHEICEHLRGRSSDSLWAAFEAIEAERRRLGTPPGLVYGRCLLVPALAPLEARLIALFEAEPDHCAMDALAATIARAEPSARARWRALRARLAQAVDQRPPPEARAWVSACDGAGEYLLEVIIERPADCPAPVGALGFGLSLTVDHRALDAWVDPTVDVSGLLQLRVEVQDEVGGWAELPPSEAAALARACKPIAHERPLVGWVGRLFERVAHPQTALPASPAPGAAPTVSGLLERLRRPPYVMWLLTGDALDRMACPHPDEEPAEIWLPLAREAIVDTGDARRWAERARYMAWWFERAGQPDEAGVLASAARGMEVDPAGAPLTWALAEHTAEHVLGGPGDALDAHRQRHDPIGYTEAVLRLAADDAAECLYDPDAPPAPDAWLALDDGQRTVAVARWDLRRGALREGVPEEPVDRWWAVCRARALAWVESRVAAGTPRAVQAIVEALSHGRSRAVTLGFVAAGVACVRAEAPDPRALTDAQIAAALPALLKLDEQEKPGPRRKRAGGKKRGRNKGKKRRKRR